MSPLSTTPTPVRYAIAGIALLIIIVMVTISTRREVAIADEPTKPAPPKELPAEKERKLAAEQNVEVQMKQSETKVDKLAK